MFKKLLDSGAVTFIGWAALLIFAVIAFLATGNDAGHSGWFVFFHHKAGYVIGSLFFLLLAAGSVIWATKIYKKQQDTTAAFWAVLVLAVALLTIGVGKGCTDKANDHYVEAQP